MADRELPFSSVVVAGIAVPVKLVRGLDKRGYFSEAGIQLAPDAQPSTAKTLVHELVHAWEYHYEIPMAHSKVTALENALFELIRQREVVRWIQRGRW